VTPEAKEHFDKARQRLTRARTILAAGVGEDAGRNAYLAAFHAAQALIAERIGKDAKTHKGVHAQFADEKRAPARSRAAPVPGPGLRHQVDRQLWAGARYRRNALAGQGRRFHIRARYSIADTEQKLRALDAALLWLPPHD